MKKGQSSFGIVAACGLVLASAAWSPAIHLGASTAVAVPPEPDPVPRRWQLDVEAGPLRVTSVEDGERGTQSFYYMTYKVTNNSGGDVLFAPAFDLMDTGGVLVRSGRDVSAEVTRKILATLDNPLLKDQISALGLLLQGPENARQGLVIWPASSLASDELTVYAAGFSGETRAVETKDVATGKPLRSLLRKTLMLRYASPGDQDHRGNVTFPMAEKRWILR
jgi:hypothetical protein